MKILVRYDSPTWAFAKRAANYMRFAPDGWTVHAASDGMKYPFRGWDGVLLLDCKASGDMFGKADIARLIASHAWLHEYDATDWRTRGVNGSRCASKLTEIAAMTDVLAVYNRAQYEAMQKFDCRLVLAPYSVNCNLFTPAVRPTRGKLRVGWCYQVSGGLNSFKGLVDVLLPLIAKMGNAVEWSVLTPESSDCLGQTELVEWYQSLDVFLCTSSGEGGPQGPFEAAACGAVVVSTDVGQVTDWSALRAAGLTVPTYRNAEEAAETVQKMVTLLGWLSRGTMLRDCREKLVTDIRENWNAEVLCPQQLREMFP